MANIFSFVLAFRTTKCPWKKKFILFQEKEIGRIVKFTLKPILWWAPKQIPTPKSCAPTISPILAYCVLFAPIPPYSAGTWNDIPPNSHSALWVTGSMVAVSSFLTGSLTSYKYKNKKKSFYDQPEQSIIFPTYRKKLCDRIYEHVDGFPLFLKKNIVVD